MEKRWTTFALISISNTWILDGNIHVFDRETDDASSKFTMTWCKSIEETPTEGQRVIFTNPIQAWVVQRRKCNVIKHIQKTETKQTLGYPSFTKK